MNNEEKKIGVFGSFLLTASAVSVDGIQFIFTFFPAIGVVFNTVISMFAAVTFIIWMSYWNISFLDSKYAARGLIGFLGEMIPIISSFPVWTGVIVWIIFTNKMHKKPIPSEV
jgi:hypothetical protein